LILSIKLVARRSSVYHHHRATARAGNTPPVPYEGVCVSLLVDSIGINGQPHAGVDIATNDGSRIEVKSVADGEVVKTCDGAGDKDQVTCDINGNFVRVKYEVEGGPVILQYGHFEAGSLKVKEGDRVRSGQVLGKMGMSGLVTGVHTHFHLFNMQMGNLMKDFRVVFGVDGYKQRCAGWGKRRHQRHQSWPHD
jgi:murein DD-endopeptidase MepM/ murein hydrolase activator NlpD